MSAAPEIPKNNSEKTVVVGMSGGVDSSVTAALLKEQGYRVVGLFMKNWEEKDASGACTSDADYADVERVCDRLEIPYYSVNFAREYRENVFAHFLEEYAAGHTPNPDVLCNREIKFKVFFEKAMELGADFLATGHYCRNVFVSGENCLAKGADPSKDQSYFLYTIKKEILERVLFPVGDLLKSEVRAIAARYDLATKEKKDSTGICFIGERDFRQFLSGYLPVKPGEFRRLDGTKVGEHQGAAFYTLGQRRGLALGGEGDRWFVIDKDVSKNIVFVERGQEHPALFADELLASEPTWVSGRPPEFPWRCRAKIRYRQEDQDCVVNQEGDLLKVTFDQPQRAITPRQSVVFYEKDVCVGGAVIERPGPSYHERGLAVS